MRPEPQQYRAWADAAVGALQHWYNPRTGLWKTAGWWNCANALTVVIHHSQRTGERRYRYVIETTFSRAQRVNLGFSNEYYDDDGWWALAWIAAFDLIGDEKYLDLARKLFAGMALAGMTCAAACGGRAKTLEERDTERAVLAHCRTPASAHDRFRQRRGHLSRLGAARVAVVSGQRAICPAGLVNDGLTADCANNGDTAWTYNQGVIARGLTVLDEITGDSTYLRQAEAIATATLRDLTVPPGILYRARRAAGREPRRRPGPIQGHLRQEPVRALPAHSARRIPRLHPRQRNLAMAQEQEPAQSGWAGMDRTVRPGRRGPAGIGARRPQRRGGCHRSQGSEHAPSGRGGSSLSPPPVTGNPGG